MWSWPSSSGFSMQTSCKYHRSLDKKPLLALLWRFFWDQNWDWNWMHHTHSKHMVHHWAMVTSCVGNIQSVPLLWCNYTTLRHDWEPCNFLHSCLVLLPTTDGYLIWSFCKSNLVTLLSPQRGMEWSHKHHSKVTYEENNIRLSVLNHDEKVASKWKDSGVAS